MKRLVSLSCEMLSAAMNFKRFLSLVKEAYCVEHDEWSGGTWMRRVTTPQTFDEAKHIYERLLTAGRTRNVTLREVPNIFVHKAI